MYKFNINLVYYYEKNYKIFFYLGASLVKEGQNFHSLGQLTAGSRRVILLFIVSRLTVAPIGIVAL